MGPQEEASQGTGKTHNVKRRLTHAIVSPSSWIWPSPHPVPVVEAVQIDSDNLNYLGRAHRPEVDSLFLDLQVHTGQDWLLYPGLALYPPWLYRNGACCPLSHDGGHHPLCADAAVTCSSMQLCSRWDGLPEK